MSEGARDAKARNNAGGRLYEDNANAICGLLECPSLQDGASRKRSVTVVEVCVCCVYTNLRNI